MKNLFIGIDFSKKKFATTLFESDAPKEKKHKVLENNTSGFKSLLGWVKCNSKIESSRWLFCGEHTGLYSLGLSLFLVKKNLFMWLENPMQIKKVQA